MMVMLMDYSLILMPLLKQINALNSN